MAQNQRRPRKGSSLAPKTNPEWYKKIDSILGDTNTDLNELVSTSLDSHTAKRLNSKRQQK